MPPRPQNFVCLQTLNPDIRIAMRYHTSENFTGQPVPGYTHPVALLHKKTAHALLQAQAHFHAQGYDIVIYDAYRPQKASDFFKKWTLETAHQERKSHYYPLMDKQDLFDRGFIASRSAHSRGNAVDLSLIACNTPLPALVDPQPRVLEDGTNVTYLYDNTLDMGMHFDFFGPESCTASTNISAHAQSNRQFLQETMHGLGFENYEKEWWHFHLKDDPNPTQFYDLDLIDIQGISPDKCADPYALAASHTDAKQEAPSGHSFFVGA